MAENDMIITRYAKDNWETVVYRPAPGSISEAERKKREDIIIRALNEYTKDRVRRKLAEKEAAAQC